jgi:hypothetical protein
MITTTFMFFSRIQHRVVIAEQLMKLSRILISKKGAKKSGPFPSAVALWR